MGYTDKKSTDPRRVCPAEAFQQQKVIGIDGTIRLMSDLLGHS